MLTIILQVDEPAGHAIGTKEAVAMDLEAKYGNVKVISVEETLPEQMRMEGAYGPKRADRAVQI